MIHLVVPAELADELVASGVGRVRPAKPRGTLIELVVVGATTMATCVTILQGPETVSRVARALSGLAKKRNGQKLEVHIKGRKGEIHLLDCDENTPLEELSRLVKDRLLG